MIDHQHTDDGFVEFYSSLNETHGKTIMIVQEQDTVKLSDMR